jgi:hypothetical protein
MKVKTNLSSKELELVSKGLSQLAKHNQADGKFVPENPAESELIEFVSDSLDRMLDNISNEVKELFDE